MLPVAPKDVGRLSDVLISALASTGQGSDNRMRLPKVKHAVVILVDGLGLENLKQANAHARFLNAKNIDGIRCEFPSTTATSISGLGTGLRSGDHGIVGYSAYDRSSGAGINLLTGWANVSQAAEYKKRATLSEHFSVNVIGPRTYAGTGFTELTMKSANYVPAESLADRFEALEKIITGSLGTVSYLYIPELDQIAHKFGVASHQWLNQLEELDLVVNRFASKLIDGVGVILTADHGVLDVANSSHVYLEEHDWYANAVVHTAGDPRCNFVYLRDTSTLDSFMSLARKVFGSAAYVCTARELVEAGWLSDFATDVEELLPDVFLIWHDSVVGYDRRIAKPAHLKMIGQHGGISDIEMRIPLIKMGSY